MGLGAGVSLLGSTAAAVTAPSSLDGAPGIPLHAVDVVVHDGFGNPLGNQSFVVRAAVEAGTLAQARLVGQLVAVSSGGMCGYFCGCLSGCGCLALNDVCACRPPRCGSLRHVDNRCQARGGGNRGAWSYAWGHREPAGCVSACAASVGALHDRAHGRLPPWLHPEPHSTVCCMSPRSVLVTAHASPRHAAAP